MTDRRIIKRYANRKLYDTQHSRYVTLEQISEMIRAGDDVKIIDNKSKEDLTSVTLAQIIFEEEKKQRSFLPLQAMRNIIQHGGESFAQMVSEAQRRVVNILPRKEDGEEGEEGEEPGESEVVDVGDGDTYAGGKKREALPEFREWIQQSQRRLDEWQKQVDGRIRNVVEGISPFAGLNKEVGALATRIAELEQQLTVLAEHEAAAAASDDGAGETEEDTDAAATDDAATDDAAADDE